MRAFGLLASLLVVARTAQAAPPNDYPFRPVPFSQVTIGDAFWGPRMATNRNVTVWYDFRKCEETGRIANFARAGGLEEGKFEGIPFNDSDVVKVIEGASYALALDPKPELDRYLDALIAKIAGAQEQDGYLYTARTLGFTNGMTGAVRWSNLRSSHELYNVGHLYEAAVAHFQATGKRSLLDVAIKNADLICRVFGAGDGQRKDVPGHEEIEIGLVRLYRATGDAKYLRQAEFFIDMRGRKDLRGEIYGEYCQDHLPVAAQSEAVGHAVRGGYLYAGVADVAAITGRQEYLDAINRIWTDVVGRKLYLIGNVGQQDAGEGYRGAYELTNLRAYNETCAAIALAQWNQRMFLLHGDAKYIDVLERIIYNAVLAGVSLGGDQFFYPNPLACDMQFKFNHGALERSPWFDCSCCPVNVVRFLPSIAGSVYAQRDEAVYVNLFVDGGVRLQVNDAAVNLIQTTRYPWDGKVQIEVQLAHSSEFAMHLRIPGWAQGRVLPSDLYRYVDDRPVAWELKVNGQKVATDLDRGYCVIRRAWQAGDVVELNLPMPIRRVLANERIVDNRGRVAVERGPIVYCAEGADHDGRVLNRVLPDDAKLSVEHRADLLGGVTVIKGPGLAAGRGEDKAIQTSPAELTLIPYYAWCHRGANEMVVWLPRSAERAELPPPPTIASTSRVTASHCWSRDSVTAVNDLQLPASSIDHDIPRHTYWDHRGTREWLQFDFQAPTVVSGVEVYWFDDTGRGHCRVPESWRLLYRDGNDWRPVSSGDRYGVAKDRFNPVRFPAVKTDGLRLEVQLQPDFSGGVLEWTVQGE